MNSGEYLDRILEEFSRIATIPRPSHHEKQIGAYLRGRKRYIVQST